MKTCHGCSEKIYWNAQRTKAVLNLATLTGTWTWLFFHRRCRITWNVARASSIAIEGEKNAA